MEKVNFLNQPSLTLPLVSPRARSARTGSCTRLSGMQFPSLVGHLFIVTERPEKVECVSRFPVKGIDRYGWMPGDRLPFWRLQRDFGTVTMASELRMFSEEQPNDCPLDIRHMDVPAPSLHPGATVMWPSADGSAWVIGMIPG